MAHGKKNAARRRATLVFVDESGFSERPPIRRTWAPRGETPVLRPRGRCWRQLSAIGALTYHVRSRRAGVYLRLHAGVVRSAAIVRFLRHLRRHVRGPLVVLWDGLNAHRSAETRAYLARARHTITVERLPAYAPELNPVEALWAWTKGTLVANVCPPDLPPIAAALRRGRRRAHRRPRLLLGFLRKTGLSL